MSGSGVNGDEVYFKNDKHNDGIDVEFSIKDSIGRGYVFPNNSADPKDPTCLGQALAAKLITGPNHCPQPGETWPGFVAKEVTDKTLTVFDTNGHLQYFGFALFIVNPEDQGLIPYDPIGNNQNGGRSSPLSRNQDEPGSRGWRNPPFYVGADRHRQICTVDRGLREDRSGAARLRPAAPSVCAQRRCDGASHRCASARQLARAAITHS